MTSVVAIHPQHPEAAVLRRAADILRRGGLVAFPTETVYGLGANALDEHAVRGIFEAKGRPSYNPLIAHLPDLERARRLSVGWSDAAEALGRRFWPGPLTLVVPKRPDIPDVVTAGLDTVAVRVPAHPVADALLALVDLPLAAPSANRFTEVSPTTAQHVAKGLGGRVELILDGGPTPVGIESTVVDVSGERPVLLRPGSIDPRALEEVVGPLASAAALHGAAPRPAPGMVERHYSPRAQLRVYPRSRRDALRAAAEAALADGEVVGAMLLDGLGLPIQHPVRMPDSPDAYARELYSTLHRLDDAGCRLIVVDAVPELPEWAGIRDRLRRAAS